MSTVTDRAKAVLAGVSPGPWRWEPSKHIRTGYVITAGNRTAVHATEWGEYGPKPEQFNHADANFAAEARTLVPELVAEVERLHRELWDAARRIRSFATDCTNHGDMTPAAKRQWHNLADTIHRSAVES